MKRLALLLMLSLFCGLAVAAGADHALASYKSAFDIQSQTSRQMEINFTLPDYDVYETKQDGQIYHRIKLPDAGTLLQSGLPELPVITTTIAIPHQGGVNIEVINSQHTILTQYNAYPLQQGQELESSKAFVKNSQYYSSGGAYPAATVEYSDPMILRDFRIITIQINPFTYDRSTQELSVFNNIQLRVSFTNEAGINELAAPVQQISSSFDKIYDATIQNYAEYRDILYSRTPPRYLVIYGQSTDNTFLSALDSFVLWKRQKGATVDLANTSSADAGSSTSSIQTYIRNRYNNPSTRPDYIVLIGDTSGSFSVPAHSYGGGGTDYPYTFMNTGDMLGDVFIGRISVENTSQFLVLLNKIYLYERDLDLGTADWLNHMLLVGDNQPSGVSTMYINKYIKEMAQEVNPDYTFTEQYGPDFNSFVPAINAAFNQGIGFYSFRGYIDFSPPSESSIFNGFKLPHAIIITCSTGNYSGGTAETEQIIRYGTTAAPKGAVTAIGMSTSSTHTTFNNVLHGGIFDGIFTHGMSTMGEAMLRGKLYMHDIFGVSSPDNVGNFTHWCNLMGDPTMEVYTGIPSSFQVSTEATIVVGLSLFDVEVKDADDLPVEGASVVLSLGPNILSRGYTDIEGNVILILPTPMIAGNAVLTVHKHNFKPLQNNIAIVDLATLVPAAIIIDDDVNGASSGNDNGIATAGETLEIFFGLLNTGSESVSGVSGSITSESPWINILQSEISYPAIMGGAFGNNLVPIVMEVAPDTPHKTNLRLHLDLTDSEGNTYSISEFIEVEAAKVNFVSVSVVDGQNSYLSPNEIANLNLSLVNNGAAAVTEVYGRLYTDNDLISMVDNSAYFGTLGLGQTVSTTAADNFRVWLRPETLPGMVMPLYVRLYNADGFEQIVHFSFTVGNVTSTDPLGPDDYGYVIYDWTDNAYPESGAIYEWFEIATSLGGLGTSLPISDSYTGTEGDQVGAQSLAVVNLPFPFQFYGRLYDQITVCSNGFLAMGVTENAEFRNFRLPGAMGPSPMIAPFWDDLATHGGSGIYTYFDRNNHSFIIEWFNLYNGKNGSSPETFQVILYDQSTYATSLGDGPIKFQYHTFNNVDSQSGSRHGNYSTIGIEDHSGRRGLEYSFNNIYPTAAAPLTNGKALYITNVPIYYEAANLLIEETYLTDDNNVAEPGEIVKLGIQIQNSGNVEANEVQAVLSTDNAFITMINAVSTYFDLPQGASGINRTPFEFEIATDFPADGIVSFNLELTAGEAVWSRMFSVSVEANKLKYHSFMLSDHNGNFDGVVDAGEEIQVIVNLQNNSAVDAHNVAVMLSTEHASLQILNPEFTIPVIAANQIMQVVFNLDFANVSGPADYLFVHFTAHPDNGQSIDLHLNIPFNLPIIDNNFELDDGSFRSETGWAWGNPVSVIPYSGNKVWASSLGGHYPNNVLYHLYTPRYTLDTNSTLSFMHYYSTEAVYDGANVSISTNGGQSWQVIIPVGGYTNAAVDGLMSQAGWTGYSNDWQSANFNLSAYNNMEVMFRFRLGSNGAVTSAGWFIDDFQLNGVNLKTGHLQGTIYPSSGADPSSAVISSNLRYSTNADSDGHFNLYLPNGTHSATAALQNHQNSTQNNIQISVDNPVVTAEFTLIDLPSVESLSFFVDNDSGLFTMLWMEPADTVFPISNYRVYRRFDSGPYKMIQESADTNYSETFVLEGAYRFYVVPVYMNEEGGLSQIVYAPYPYVGTEENSIPGLITSLGKNYPNPFNPTTTIQFSLAEAGRAKLSIYNTRGQLVRQLADSDYLAGKHQLVWDGRDRQGKSVASGLYFYRLQAGKYSQSHKMILMK